MINYHDSHSLVVVKQKLFVIDCGNNNCEVFEDFCRKFIALKSSYSLHLSKAMSIGKKIVIFQNNSSLVIYYDVDKNEWFKESCEVTKNLEDFSCVKIPSY